MQRRGSIALLTVAISALASGQAAMSIEPPTTAPTSSTLPPAAATVREQTNEPAMIPGEREMLKQIGTITR